MKAKEPRRGWLVKSEPEVYSISDLEREGQTAWEGVRNYQARNFMRDEMKVGDWVLFYHSNADPSGIAGMAEVRREGYPDPTQFDRASEYFDPRAKPDDPPWCCIDIVFARKFPRVVTLREMKDSAKLEGCELLRRGQRLSVLPFEKAHLDVVLTMAKAPSRGQATLPSSPPSSPARRKTGDPR